MPALRATMSIRQRYYYLRRLRWSARVERSRPSVCLFVCLFVCSIAQKRILWKCSNLV